MMKKVISIVNQQLYPSQSMCLILLYFLVTYVGMYRQLPSHDYVHAPLCGLTIALVATLWLYERLDRCLDKTIYTKPFLEITYCFVHLMPRHMSLTLGIWTGGFLSMATFHNPIPGWILGGILVVFPYNLFLPKNSDYSMKLLRGSYVMTMEQVYMRLMQTLQKGDELIIWAGQLFPEWVTAGHMMIMGAVNSGKTVLMRMLMQSTLPTIKEGSDRRAIIFDAKKNIMPLLAGMEVTCPIVILNPFHADSYALDWAEDVDTPAVATEVSHILIKDSKAENPFWTNAARDLFGGVMKALIVTKPRRWTLAEALDILSDLQRTKELLRSVPLTAYLEDLYLNGDERTMSNIRSTIAANFAGLREIANLSANTLKANPDRKISLRQWVHQESILILGSDERFRAPMEAVNQVFIHLLGNFVLSLDDSDTRRIMLFLDEFQECGRHRNMLRLLTQARSKGLWALIVLHTLPGLQAIYGDKEAKAIAATCTNKAFLRQDCPDSAFWAAQVLGKAEILQYNRSYTDSRCEDKYSITEHIVEKDVVMPSQLLRLPRTNRDCLYGYFTSPLLGVFGGPVNFSKLLRPLADIPNFKERPAEDQYFQSDSDDKPERRESEINLMDIPRMTRKALLEALKNENRDSDNEN